MCIRDYDIVYTVDVRNIECVTFVNNIPETIPVKSRDNVCEVHPLINCCIFMTLLCLKLPYTLCSSQCLYPNFALILFNYLQSLQVIIYKTINNKQETNN